MYWSSVIEYLVEQRLAEARAGASQRALLRSLRPARQSLFARAGLRLTAAGQRVLRTVRASASASAAVRGEPAGSGSRSRRQETSAAPGERAA